MTLPLAISGLGGIGKTQIANEYAYRYRNEYQVVLWVNCASREELMTDFIAIAALLNLPEKNIQNQSVAINAVKRWLETHTDWLLILDNADDLAMVREYLLFGNKGHILLTTRSQTMSGLAQKIEIEKMPLEDGVLFLLRRAAIITPGKTLNDVSETDQIQRLTLKYGPVVKDCFHMPKFVKRSLKNGTSTFQNWPDYFIEQGTTYYFEHNIQKLSHS